MTVPQYSQHLNSKLAQYTDFEYKHAVKENNTAVAIVRKVIQHFKDQKKIVYLIGHSYGGFLVQEFLKQYGNLADANAVLNCRLDMDDVVWKGGQNGKAYQFNSAGENPTEISIPKEMDKQEARNTAVLASGLGTTRYSKALKEVDLSRTIFIDTKNDEAVGHWTKTEIDFLKNKSVKYFYGPGDHSEIFEYKKMRSLSLEMIK